MYKQNNDADLIAEEMNKSLEVPYTEKDQKIEEAIEQIKLAAETFADIHNITKSEKAKNINIVLSELSQKTMKLCKKQG